MFYKFIFTADWFMSNSDNGDIAAVQGDEQKTTIYAENAGLYQIYRRHAEPDGNGDYQPIDEIDWWTLPLDVVISGGSAGDPYLTLGWLQEHWRWDEETQKDVVTFTEDRLNGHHEGCTMAPGQVFNLIFYLHYYDADTGRWVSEPVEVEAMGESAVVLHSLSAQAVAGQSNGAKFVALDATKAAWAVECSVNPITPRAAFPCLI